jgi:hypothetical protein
MLREAELNKLSSDLHHTRTDLRMAALDLEDERQAHAATREKLRVAQARLEMALS